MTGIEMWELFVTAHPEYQNAKHEIWCYGSDDPDALLALTLQGAKTATASAFPVYEYEQCALPSVGDCSVIINTQGEAACIIRTTHVTVLPFCEVSAEHAYREGEGDRSLTFWRKVHAHVFTMELAEIGMSFTANMPVVCEAFTLVYPEGNN